MLDQFEITRRWPAENPDVIQLYSVPTPNGIKVSAMLEETGLDYEPHLIRFADDDQFTPEYLSLNPNNKIPSIIDPHGPGNKPLGLWESGAILIYLAEKTGKLLSKDPVTRYHTLQWLMWQMGGGGPMMGQFGFFHAFAGKEIEDKRPYDRYKEETIRLLGVLDDRLEGREYVMGDEYSIADIAIWPWIRVLRGHYDAHDILEMDDVPNVLRWLEKCMERPASKVAVNTPKRD